MKKIIIVLTLLSLSISMFAQVKHLQFKGNINFETVNANKVINIICFSENKTLRYSFEKQTGINPFIIFLSDKDKNSNNTTIINSLKTDSIVIPKSILWRKNNEGKIKQKEVKIKETTESKQLHNFLCKKFIVKSGENNYDVWITEDFSYNWSFLNFINKLPGTVILAKLKEKTVFEFESLEDVDYSKIMFTKDHFIEILSKW